MVLMGAGCSILFPEEEISLIKSNTPTPLPTASPEPTATPTIEELEIEVPEGSVNAILREKAPADSTQVILVMAIKDEQRLYLAEKQDNGLWKVAEGAYPVTSGRNGLGKEKEGDGKSPEGVFELGTALGFGDKPDACTWPWQDVDEDDYWVEDANSSRFNQFVSADDIVNKDWEKASKLNVKKYERAIEIKYNTENQAELGSAIFIHVWAGEDKATGGGTATSKKNMDTILNWLEEDQHPVLVQVSVERLLPMGFGYAIDYAPDIRWDIKFSGEDNFLGRAVEGYSADVAIVSEDCGRALDHACHALKSQDLALMLYDGYRPSQAQKDILKWAKDDDEKSTKDRYYPDSTKSEIRKEYIEVDKGHTQGASVDVTLIKPDGEPVDMGGRYFFFGRNSEIEGVDLSNAQYNHRELLQDVMIQAGFKPVENMWWHFDLAEKPFPGESFDFEVK